MFGASLLKIVKLDLILLGELTILGVGTVVSL